MAGRRRGRRPIGSDARSTIALEARRQFGERGYRRTTMRGIAAAAGVDARLVRHYFGTKQALFVETVELPLAPEVFMERVFAGKRDDVGLRVAEQLMAVLEEPRGREAMLALIRAAASEPEAATLIREVLTTRILIPVARRLGGERPELRAGLVATQVVGFAMARHVVGIEPLRTASREELVGALAPVFQRYLLGDWSSRRGDAPELESA